eukprot:4511469-Pyramimonas_sp.AAC.1
MAYLNNRHNNTQKCQRQETGPTLRNSASTVKQFRDPARRGGVLAKDGAIRTINRDWKPIK